VSCKMPRLHFGGLRAAVSGSSVDIESWCVFSSAVVLLVLANDVHFGMVSTVGRYTAVEGTFNLASVVRPKARSGCKRLLGIIPYTKGPLFK
jgi:hypothetical protein